MASSITFLAALLSISRLAASRAVFAHYLVGGLNDDHAAQDIQDAINMGLDGFALNIADPYQPYVEPAVDALFTHATNTPFKLFFSMDLGAESGDCSGGSGPCNGPNDYNDLLDKYLPYDAYYKDDNGKPLVSTFSASTWGVSEFANWRQNRDITFVPDFDGVSGYGSDAWWDDDQWGSVVDGVFSWEYTWPGLGSKDDGDVTNDQNVLNSAVARNKSYMVGLSLVQYKDAYGANLYRRGEETLSIRMQNILAMDPAPLYIEIITWNDGPESHYIGNLWPESDSNTTYTNDNNAPHTGLQPLLHAFADAFRTEQTSFPAAAANTPVGAMWYKTILQSTTCAGVDPPMGAAVGDDTLSWAVVMPADSGLTIQLVSQGAVIQSVAAQAGLNHGSTISSGTPINAGAQQLRLVDGAGAVMFSTSPGRCVYADCVDGIYNYNPQVVQLMEGSQAGSSC